MGHTPAVLRNTEIEFCEIMERYSDPAYHIALRLLLNAADAEDAVQEAIMSPYRAFPILQVDYLALSHRLQGLSYEVSQGEIPS